MTEADAIQLFKCLADKSRIQILKSLMQEEMYVERLAERLGLTAPTVSFHLKKLEDAGMVESRKEQYYTIYSLKKEVFMTNIMDILKEESTEAREQEEREAAYREKVLSSFFSYGKLKNIPSQRKKERIVLEELIKSFEPDKKYSEREVNLILADFYDDFCTLRRDMVDEGLFAREGMTYWRVQ